MLLRKIYLTGLGLFLTGAALLAQTELNSLEEISQFGSENNLQYRTSQISVLKAEDNLQSLFLLDQSSISASGSYSQNNESFGFNASVTIPVLEQVSLSGSISDDLSGSASLSLSPLAHSDGKEQSEFNLESAYINAETARLNAEEGAVSAALNWMSAWRNYETQKLETELNQEKYLDDKVRFDVGEISFDELQDSLVQWSSSRVSLTTVEKQYHTAETSLYSQLGVGRSEVQTKLMSIEDLENELALIMNQLESLEGDFLNNNSLKLSVINTKSSLEAMEDTWIYNPDLRASVSMTFDDEGYRGFSASVSLSFSLDDIQISERKISQEEYAIAKVEEIQMRNEAEMAFDQILDAIESTAINREIATIEFEQTKILMSEAQLLYARGDISPLDLEEAAISLAKSENSLFSALTEEILAWYALKQYL